MTDSATTALELACYRDWYNSWTDVRSEDIEQVVRVLSAGSLSVVSGGPLARFENRFSKFAGAAHAVAFNNGTAAIYAALWALGVRCGDDVLVCDYGFHGMAAAIIALGARIIPVDCDPESLTLAAEDVSRSRTDKTKAILVHNPWGVPADFEAIRANCGVLPIVSDASHAHGATYRNRPLAAWADVTCFSLGVGKLITGGELGCAVTDSEELRDRMLALGHVNRVPNDLRIIDWCDNAVGLKLRPHLVALLLAHAQLKRFDEKLSNMRRTCQRLENSFSAHGFIPLRVPSDSERSYWRIVFILDQRCFAEGATELIREELKKESIPTEANHYWPLLQHQAIFKWPGHEKFIVHRACPIAQETAPRTITLPAPVVLPESVMTTATRAAGKASEAVWTKQGAALPRPRSR